VRVAVASFGAGFVGPTRIASLWIGASQIPRGILNEVEVEVLIEVSANVPIIAGIERSGRRRAGLAVLSKVSENQLRRTRSRLRCVATNNCYERSRASTSMSLRRGSMIWINQLRWSVSQPVSLKRDR
jgi:hypothetical protein